MSTTQQILNGNSIQTQLILEHNKLVQELERKYMNHINELLFQKNAILIKMQQQFVDRMGDINKITANMKETRMKQQNIINHKNEKHRLFASNHTQNILIESNDNLEQENNERNHEREQNLDIIWQSNIRQKKQNKHQDIPEIIISDIGNAEKSKGNKTNNGPKRRRSKKFDLKQRENEQNNQNTEYYECGHCSKQNLSDHLKSIHSKTTKTKSPNKSSKKHKCVQCEYSTNKLSILKDHIRTHSTERPFVCTQSGCNKAFKRKCGLNQHLKQHLGVKPFKCRHIGCNKSFVAKQEINSAS